MMVTFEGMMLVLGTAGGFGVSFDAAFGEAVLADWWTTRPEAIVTVRQVLLGGGGGVCWRKCNIPVDWSILPEAVDTDVFAAAGISVGPL